MSNITPFVVGLGSGLMLWHLGRSEPRAEPALRNAAGACVITLDPGGVAVDGERVEIAEAVRRAHLAGLALVTMVPDAPASTCAALFAALGDAAVPTHTRTLVAQPRNATDLRTDFTLRVYPQGSKSTSTERYFRAEVPISWREARDRLAAAGIVDLVLAGRTSRPGGWMLSIDKREFSADRAELLPGAPRNSHFSATFTLALYPEGVGGPVTRRWFSSSAPVSWDDAAERLADTGIIDPSITLPLQPGYWILAAGPVPFDEAKAEPLPKRKRRRNAEPSTMFTLAVYPQGTGGPTKITQWFRAESPTSWEDARDRLAAARYLDPRAIAPGGAGYWRLVTDPRVFDANRARPLPEPSPRDARIKQRFTLEGGRTILRDGEPIIHIERVNLGDERYALSPVETDRLGARIARLLNKQGTR